MDKKILMLCVALIIFSTAVHVHSETIPANIWEFTRDYYRLLFFQPQSMFILKPFLQISGSSPGIIMT